MTDALKDAFHIVSLMKESVQPCYTYHASNSDEHKLLTEAIHKAPEEAFREQADEDGNALLHTAICILRGHPGIGSILRKIIHKDNKSVRKTNCHGQLALHLACKLLGAGRGDTSLIDLLVEVYQNLRANQTRKGVFPFAMSYSGQKMAP